MKIKFKKQSYQTKAVESVVDCFIGQIQQSSGMQYSMDSRTSTGNNNQLRDSYELFGFKNNEITLNHSQLLVNINKIQHRQNLPLSIKLINDNKTNCSINLDIEMETGTGKTYCYIKTMFELNRNYGWSKFIVVVPSIAIREGAYKSLEITADHFLEEYGKRARFFIYNSKQLHNLENYSSDAGINVMIINVQAFNASGKDARRIYEELDSFQSRRPIDVIKSNCPILILDEPQKMGAKTLESLKEFNPLMILRYSATHKTEYNKIYRLDALDAYHQKLVKKIAVRGISVKGLSGASAYLFLEGIDISIDKSPLARIELEVKYASGIKRIIRKLHKNDNLYEISGSLSQYKGFVISDINAITDTVAFTNGIEINSGVVIGDSSELALRRIQIREAIKAHIEKEKNLFSYGIKVLTLFFIDSVAKYRGYDESGAIQGEYAKIFEEEYDMQINEFISNDETQYSKYIKSIMTSKTHNGYFSIDKTNKHLIDPLMNKKSIESDDVDAYDLILKDKERLLSLNEPVRFIFSHSALREGWDNPNVFVICTLKHSDNTISRRQEVGRGMRISVNQLGDRMDDPLTVHEINVLTIIAGESYKDFVVGLQKDISDSLTARPRVADVEYFLGKLIKADSGNVEITPHIAKQIDRYLTKNNYTDDDWNITEHYHDARRSGSLVTLPEELIKYKDQIFELVDTVFSDSQMPMPENERYSRHNNINANFNRKEFKALWSKINKKAAYTVHFESIELVKKCINALNGELHVTPLQYIIHSGEQTDFPTYEEVTHGDSFHTTKISTSNFKESIHSSIRYDLIGKLSEETKLTRLSIANILCGIEFSIFNQFKINPEDFISKTSRIINEQKATVIIEHLSYDPITETYSLDIFTKENSKYDVTKVGEPLKHHIYNYVFTDSQLEANFVKELDASAEVVVYAKLPRGFFIPTPVGNYNPDWAIAYKEGTVKHIYFIAETKGSLSSMELRKIEECKIACARKFFSKITSDKVKYDVVDSYSKLMELVK